MAYVPRFGVPDDYEWPGLPTVADLNLLKNALEQNAGGHVYDLHGVGVYDGWQPTAAKQVTAGNGIVGVGGLVGHTDEATDIDNLTDGETNYIYAVPNADTVQTGDVDFQATLLSIPSEGYVLLGSLTLDGGGTVTHINGIDVAEEYEDLWERDELFRLKRGKAHGSGTTELLTPEAAEVVEIAHDDQVTFAIPGAVTVTLDSADFECDITENAREDRFSILITNVGAYEEACGYTWERKGIV